MPLLKIVFKSVFGSKEAMVIKRALQRVVRGDLLGDVGFRVVWGAFP